MTQLIPIYIYHIQSIDTGLNFINRSINERERERETERERQRERDRESTATCKTDGRGT